MQSLLTLKFFLALKKKRSYKLLCKLYNFNTSTFIFKNTFHFSN